MPYNFDCRLFNGYKPCRHKRPCDGCPHYDPVKFRVAIVHLEALGAVLRSTTLLEPLRRKYAGCHITWITTPAAGALLENNPLIDRLILLDGRVSAALDHLEFDLVCSVDKSLEGGAIAERLKAKEKRGFGLTPGGAVRPLNAEATYQFDVGLDDQLKFFTNQKPETQQTTESMALAWARDPYLLALTPAEREEVARRRVQVCGNAQGVIGFNTGCSLLFPYKKFTVERSVETIRAWRKNFPDYAVALLGGREDAQRNWEMKEAFKSDARVVLTPTDGGLRNGVLWVDTSDVVFSGCSLGMHIAIALQKQVIAWFGVSCAQEVDLYDRGVKLQSEVTCSPCWKKSCSNEPKCFNQVSTDRIVAATAQVLERL